MDVIVINGGKALAGAVKTSGAKAKASMDDPMIQQLLSLLKKVEGLHLAVA